MLRSRLGMCVGLGMLSLALPAGSAVGATITGVSVSVLPGSSTGTIGPVGSTPAPNNDNSTGPSPNVIPYSIFYNTQGTTDVEFVLSNSGGTTEYRFTQALLNNTGTPWTGFLYELGFGTGTNFVRSAAGDQLDFDAPDGDPAPTSNAFSALNLQIDTLDWTAGMVPQFSTLIVSFSVDAPDNLAAFNPGGENRFTLRQVPTIATTVVPEPGGLALLAVALSGLLLVRRSDGRLS